MLDKLRQSFIESDISPKDLRIVLDIMQEYKRGGNMKPTGKYAYSLNDQDYCDSYNTIDEAFKEACEEIKYLDEEVKTVYIGEVMKFVPCVDAYSVIEQMQNKAWEDSEELSDDYLEGITKEDMQLLETMLTETFNKWAKKTHNEPNFSTVELVEERKL